MCVCNTGDSLMALRGCVGDFLRRCMPTSRWSSNLCCRMLFLNYYPSLTWIVSVCALSYGCVLRVQSGRGGQR